VKVAFGVEVSAPNIHLRKSNLERRGRYLYGVEVGRDFIGVDESVDVMMTKVRGVMLGNDRQDKNERQIE
jgi:hypothetical protein